MLWTLAFERIGVAVADIYFADPTSDPGPVGRLKRSAKVALGRNPDAERGVRLELRMFERDELKGSVYSAVPIRVDRPIWRVDLLETVDSEPGSLNRAHHHPRFHDWDPGGRVFVEELSNDPVPWVRGRFAEIETVLAEAGVDVDEVGVADVERLRASGPMVVDVVGHLLGEVAAGRAGLAPAEQGEIVRESWL